MDDILSQLRDAVVVLDGSNKVVHWLGAAEKIFGWQTAEITGKAIDDFLAPEDGNGNKACIGSGESSRKLGSVTGTPEQDVFVAAKDGSRIWVGVTSNFDRDSRGRVIRTFAVLRDITRRKTIDLTKSDVISAVSHELRSPLSSIKGFTSTLLNRWDVLDDATKKHLLETINSDSDRVTRMINELLDVSRLESGRLELRRERIQVEDIIQKVVDRFLPRLETHSLTVDADGSSHKLLADADKVEQVITNLVENAVKYTPSGQVQITVASSSSLVKVSVTDEGVAIPQDQRKRIFDKFFRSDRPGNPTGTGLGLFISRGLIEAHGGDIWVEEAPGGGSKFIFTLPVAVKL